MIQLGKQKYQEIDLLPGEQLLHVYEGNPFPTGSNPLLKMIGAIQRMMTKLCCGHAKMFMVLTNMRVLFVESSSMMCGANAAKSFTTIAASGVLEAGVGKTTTSCCCHARTVFVQSKTELRAMEVRKFKDKDLADFMGTFSQHIIRNTQAH